MKYFLIDSFDRGCCGKRYPNLKAAIIDGGYSVWTERKIKSAFNFGAGTAKDFKRFAKCNFCKIVSEPDFYKLLEKIEPRERLAHINFINSHD